MSAPQPLNERIIAELEREGSTGLYTPVLASRLETHINTVWSELLRMQKTGVVSFRYDRGRRFWYVRGL